MAKTFLVEELASLAGVPVRQIEAWRTQGYLGEVPRNTEGGPIFGFEQAERCVELGDRGVRRRICVVNQKGGVGKTTTAFTLAAALADLGRRVLCIDLDAQANLTTSFGFDPDTLELTSADLLTEDDIGPEHVILETGLEGIHAIPADIKLVNVEARIQNAMMRERILRTKLEPLFDRYHFIIFDCPPNLSRVTINALCASEEVIVPIETQSYSIKAISDLTNTFTLLKRKMAHDLVVWLQPTKVDRTVQIATDILDALDEAFRGRLLDPIHNDPNLVRAPLLCEPVTRAFPHSPSSLEYARLARFFTLSETERRQWMALTVAERRRIIEKAHRDVDDEDEIWRRKVTRGA